MRFIQAILALMVSGPAPVTAKTPYVYPYNMMTGEELVAALGKAPTDDLDAIKRNITDAYLNGIKDGTQGALWCFTGRLKPDELNAEIVLAIRAKRSAAELRGNAAPLVLDELRKRYPCNRTKRGRP